MASEPGFIFYLDEPLEQPLRGRVPLRGWLVAHAEAERLRLVGAGEEVLELEDRPDVRTAFPAFAFASGFRGYVSPRNVRGGALHFCFECRGSEHQITKPLPIPPPRPSAAVRAWSHVLRLAYLVRARLAINPAARWRAALRALLLEFRIKRSGALRRVEADRVLALFATNMPTAVVVQIGANDGAAGDPIGHLFARTQWRGLLIEPVPHLAEALRRRHLRNPAIQIEQAAISTHDGDASLYRLRTIPGQTPEWFEQLATLDREVLLKHRSSIPEIESLIIEERTKTARLDTLLMRHALDRVDLLVIDTEGHDCEVLRQVDFNRFQPSLVMFEHQHLSPSDKETAYELLRRHGYDFAELPEGDCIAWR